MSCWHKLFLFIFISGIGLVGCGVHPTPPGLPEAGACIDTAITGTLKDSLTNQPVLNALAFLESGTRLSGTSIYNFSTIKQITSNADGSFQLCSSMVSGPSALVIVALDRSNNAYPPFVAPVSGSVAFGTILIGGCHETCAFEGQEQTSLPATIDGMI